MAAHLARKLAPTPSILLGAVALAMTAAPCAFGQATTPQSNSAQQAANPTAGISRFAVATVKPNLLNDGRWRLRFTPDGYSALGVSVHLLLQDAYGIYDDSRILGEENWVKSNKYDLEAKVDPGDAAAFQKLNLNQRRLLLQALLADRFKLAAHMDKKERPVYALVIAKNGPKLDETKPADDPAGATNRCHAVVTRSRPGQLTTVCDTTTDLAQLLSQRLDRIVVDQTGLSGRYDFKLDWTPDKASPFTNPAKVTTTPTDSSGPSIFTAVQEQLGLKLEATKGLVDVIVIDHIEPPSEN